jgi:hypothetical protein
LCFYKVFFGASVMDGGSSILSAASTTSTIPSAVVQNSKTGVNSALSLLELEGHSKTSISSKSSVNSGAPTILEDKNGNVYNELMQQKVKNSNSYNTSSQAVSSLPSTSKPLTAGRESSTNSKKLLPPVAAYTDMGLPNPEAYRDKFDEKIEELEAAEELRKQDDKEFYEREALRQRKLKDLRGQQMKYRIDGNTAEEATKEIEAEIDKLHGDETTLVNAAISEGLIPAEGLEGRFAQDELAKEIRNLATMMDIPDWLKEEDLAKQLKQEAVACRIKSREFLDKAKLRSDEATSALFLVDEALTRTKKNSEFAIARIEKRFQLLREALNEREVELKEAVLHTTTQKIEAFKGQIKETEANLKLTNEAVEKGEEAMDRNDLGYIDAYLHRLDNVLEKASMTFTAQELYATTDIPISFGHQSMRSNIAAHGTVGNIEVLAGGPRGHGILLWDQSRTEDKLEIVENGRSIKHVGPSAGKSTSISELGFGSGRNIWRMELQGLENGQWVSVGVCTAATMNTSRYSQDAVIFQASVPNKLNDDRSSNSASAAAKKFQVTNNDVIMVVLDCKGAVVEYYKNKTCIKTAMLMVYDKPKKKKKNDEHNVNTNDKSRRNSKLGSAGKSPRLAVGEKLDENNVVGDGENNIEGGGDEIETSVEQETKKKQSEKKQNEEDDTYFDKHDENYDLIIEDTVWYPFGTLYQMGQVLRFM